MSFKLDLNCNTRFRVSFPTGSRNLPNFKRRFFDDNKFMIKFEICIGNYCSLYATTYRLNGKTFQGYCRHVRLNY